MDKVFVSSDEVSVIINIPKNKKFSKNDVIETAKNFLNLDIIVKLQEGDKLRLCGSLTNVEYYNSTDFLKFINTLEKNDKIHFFTSITPIIEYVGQGAFIVDYMPIGGIYKLFD